MSVSKVAPTYTYTYRSRGPDYQSLSPVWVCFYELSPTLMSHRCCHVSINYSRDISLPGIHCTVWLAFTNTCSTHSTHASKQAANATKPTNATQTMRVCTNSLLYSLPLLLVVPSTAAGDLQPVTTTTIQPLLATARHLRTLMDCPAISLHIPSTPFSPPLHHPTGLCVSLICVACFCCIYIACLLPACVCKGLQCGNWGMPLDRFPAAAFDDKLFVGHFSIGHGGRLGWTQNR